MNQNSFSIGQVISKGWNIFSQKFGIVLKFLFVGVFAMFVVQLIVSMFGTSDNSTIGFIGGIVTYVFNIFISIGLIKAMMHIVRDEPVELNTLFSGKDQVLKYILVSILLSILIGLGFILLILPGIYLMLRFMFVPYLLVDKEDMSIEDLFSASSTMTKGIKFNLFLYGITIFIMNVIGMIPLGFGLLITMPVSFLSFIVLYETLLRDDSASTPTLTPTDTPQI